MPVKNPCAAAIDHYPKGSADHKGLEFLRNAERGRIHRWLLYLQQFNIAILHVGGNMNPIANFIDLGEHAEESIGQRGRVVKAVAC